jgi:type I restriction enzyme S subunit
MIPMLKRRAVVNPAVPELDRLDDDAEVTFMPLETVWSGSRADFTRRASKASIDTGYTRFLGGDVLMPKITPTFEAGRVTVAQIETTVGAGTTELHVIRPSAELDARYLAFLLQSQQVLQEGASTLQGVGNLRRVPEVWLQKLRVPILDLQDQRAIAEFLDRETAKIDALVDHSRRLVRLLSELRRARRSAIALDHRHTDRRESPLKWAPQVPSHWDVLPLASLARLESGHTPNRARAELWQDCYIPWISLNDVGLLSVNEYINSTTNLVSDAGIGASSARLLPAETVVLSRDATIGRSSIMRVPMATSQHFVAWVCGPRLSPRYLWLLLTSSMQQFFESLTDGATIKTIGMGDLRSLRIPLPPMADQTRMVGEAEVATGAIDSQIAKGERVIALALERRSALITAAVTGQLDVREAA